MIAERPVGGAGPGSMGGDARQMRRATSLINSGSRSGSGKYR
jgi:hypothetical protein